MARRFIVKSNDLNVIENNRFLISGSEVKHIQVLRHNIGDEIIVNNYVCKIEKMTKSTVEAIVLKEAEKRGIPKINLTLYIAMLKNDKMDYVVQKAVELGVKNIVPFISTNVIVKLDEKNKLKRKNKLQVIADEACKQCGRTDEVEVCDFKNFKEVLDDLKNNELNIFAYEKSENAHELKNVLENAKNNKIKNISCIIGPEGGFNENEAKETISKENTSCVSLGTRILRAETAVFNVISVIMYELDK